MARSTRPSEANFSALNLIDPFPSPATKSLLTVLILMVAISISGRTSDAPLPSLMAVIHNASSSDQSRTSIANGLVDLPPLSPHLVEKATLIAKAKPRLLTLSRRHPVRGSAFDPAMDFMWDGAPPVVPATLAELQLRDEEGRSLVEGDEVTEIDFHERQMNQIMIRPVHVDVHGSGTLATVFAFDQVQVPEIGHYRFRLLLRCRLPNEFTCIGTDPNEDDIISLQAVSNLFEVVPNERFEARDDVMTPMSRRMDRAVDGFYVPPAYRMSAEALTGNSNDELTNG
ncbi:uncharacterized protein MELLADRAFT_106873 [Melampsora larici-populina 98AG31]|uniref:Uncharacterized protein n=1 Tax=Melampsora larici-populina (strain 98AG31 / pathotype 3-4-7) TaxID=747676 RepID=F4RMX9_MELLP|nr:uncharacterized protein MELLADRAFT_106873 [Melampsora larici-populina 98AG31]EGG06308.1 hypothetical protein MELLADRAFT_106873 [Melampsora larici-populina 98AG31]